MPIPPSSSLHRKTLPYYLLLLLLVPCLLVPSVEAWNVATTTADSLPTTQTPSTTLKSSTYDAVTPNTTTPHHTLAADTTSTSSITTTTRASISVFREPCLPATDVHTVRDVSVTKSSELRHKVNKTHVQTSAVLHQSSQGTVIAKNVVFDVESLDSSTPFFGNETYLGEELGVVWSRTDVGLTVLKAIVMCTIIVVSVLGNVLVIVSVALHRRLHSTANYLLVSLATADMLVALCAMTFNASVELSGGRWMFGRLMCDLWNSFDVYFSTVSILHLCCISVDRYYAIVRPLEYPLTMTRRILTIMLAHCWLAPTLISFLPILLGWYTTAEHLRDRDTQPYVCSFVVNAVFALVSSAVSFWVPCTVMVVMYFRIFQEARKQERALLFRASSANSAAYSSSIRRNAPPHQQQDQSTLTRQQLLVALQTTPFTPANRHQEFLMKTFTDGSSTASVTTASSGVPSVGPSGSSSSRSSSGGVTSVVAAGNGTGTSNMAKTSGTNSSNSGSGWRNARHGSTASWHGPSRHNSHMPCNRRMHSTPLVATKSGPLPVGRREHKAARTLGLIMGAFVLCWLPFFTWYVSINVCGPTCRCPHAVVTALFWIGYFNSTLNPFIYAYFRTDFREAFHRTLKRMSCCRPRQPAGVFV
ncbi:octopamine receptor beta-2R [Cherax quadricarinatus]